MAEDGRGGIQETQYSLVISKKQLRKFEGRRRKRKNDENTVSLRFGKKESRHVKKL